MLAAFILKLDCFTLKHTIKLSYKILQSDHKPQLHWSLLVHCIVYFMSLNGTCSLSTIWKKYWKVTLFISAVRKNILLLESHNYSCELDCFVYIVGTLCLKCYNTTNVKKYYLKFSWIFSFVSFNATLHL